jgi:hypothetical protein
MKLLHYIFFITSIHKIEPCFIQNQHKPICANCKFFIPNKNECSKFGNLNIITGKYNYESANSVRKDEDKCGEYAIFFTKNNFKFITIPYSFLLKNGEKIILLSYSFFVPFLFYGFLYFIFMK